MVIVAVKLTQVINFKINNEKKIPTRISARTQQQQPSWNKAQQYRFQSKRKKRSMAPKMPRAPSTFPYKRTPQVPGDKPNPLQGGLKPGRTPPPPPPRYVQ